MRWQSIAVWIAALAMAGCEIFLTKAGGDGQPCADNGACEDGLACNFDECGPPRDEGKKCDDTWTLDYDWTDEDEDREWLESYHTCDGDLCCVNGECAETGDMVEQPETDLLWNRCPEGAKWYESTCRCRHEIDDVVPKNINTLAEIAELCGYPTRLPTLDEYLALLGGCDGSVDDGEEGECRPCAESEDCAGMFSFLDYGVDLVMYTSTNTLGPGEPGYSWFVDLKTGEVTNESMAFADFDANVLCVQTD